MPKDGVGYQIDNKGIKTKVTFKNGEIVSIKSKPITNQE
jgi:hypothetical protein